MAELIQTPSSNGENNQTPKPGRHSRFTSVEDLIIAGEVAASKAHTAGFGAVRKQFENAAAQVNKNPSMVQKVTWKTVQDRYKRLQDQFDKSDNENQKLSGVAGREMGELDQLLMMMREARDDMDAKKEAEKTAQKKKEADKVRIGEAIVAAATKRKRNGSEDDDDGREGVEGSEKEVEGPKKQKRQRRDLANDMSGEMDKFGIHLRDADMARLFLDRERLSFEREKDALDRVERTEERKERREERECERSERREEREKHMQLEVEKFKMMMEALSKK